MLCLSIFGKRKQNRGPVRFRIERGLLEMILAAARSQHPTEFLALLMAERNVIKELELLPGTVSGARHAFFLNSYMKPPDMRLKSVGTVHSHPGPSFRPSRADLEYFSRAGPVNIIVAMPYNERSWCAYSNRGDIVDLEVVDAEDDDLWVNDTG